MSTNSITAGFGVEAQSYRSGCQVDATAQLEQLLEPDPKSPDLIATLGGAARIQKRHNSWLIQGGSSIGGL